MEQLMNNFETTLASAYTAGAGSMVLTSATGLPGTGEYCLVVSDPTTRAIKVIFRVTSRAGTTVSGASEGADANCSSADVVTGSVLTVASVSALLRERGPAMKRPDGSLFSWVNQNGATENHDEYGCSMTVVGTSGANYITHRVIAAASEYTYILGFRGFGATGSYQECGPSIRDSAANKSIVFRFRQDMHIDVYTWTDPSSYSGQLVDKTFTFWGAGPVFAKIVRDSVHRTFYVATQEAALRGHWIQLYQGSNTEWMSNDDQIGFFCESNSGNPQGIDVVHFDVS